MEVWADFIIQKIKIFFEKWYRLERTFSLWEQINYEDDP